VPAELSSPIPPGLASLCDASPLAEAEPPHLLIYLAAVPDQRAARGRRHPLVAILAMAAAVVLTGARSFAAIAEWAADTPQPIRAALGGRHDPLAGGFLVPTETTIRRTLGRLDAHALAAAVGDWLVARDRHDHPAPAQRPRQRAVAIDGKTLRGRPPTRRPQPPRPLCWRRWSTPAASCRQPAGCLLSQPVTRPAQALVTAALWGRDSPPAFRARRG
jgi:DDE_Tnp_1-associated